MPVVDLQPPLIATSNQPSATTGTAVSSSPSSTAACTTASSVHSSWPLDAAAAAAVIWQSTDRYRSDMPLDSFSQWHHHHHQLNTSDHWPNAFHYHEGNLYRSNSGGNNSSGGTHGGNSGTNQIPSYCDASHQHSLLSSRQPFEQNEKYLEDLEIMQASDIIAFESPVVRGLASDGPPLMRGGHSCDSRMDTGNCDSMCLHSDSSSACDEYVVTSLDQVTGLTHLSPDANQLAWGFRRLYQSNVPPQDSRPRDLLQLTPQGDWREEYLHHQVISSCGSAATATAAVKVEPST